MKPSDRAVLAPGTVESVFVTWSASGSSCTRRCGRQAPGRVWMVDDDAAAAVGAAGAGPGMGPSGMTCWTAGSAFSRAASPADTVADSELTRV